MQSRQQQLWNRESVLIVGQTATKRGAAGQERRKAEDFLHDLAFVMKMTDKVKASMQAETCPA